MKNNIIFIIIKLLFTFRFLWIGMWFVFINCWFSNTYANGFIVNKGQVKNGKNVLYYTEHTQTRNFIRESGISYVWQKEKLNNNNNNQNEFFRLDLELVGAKTTNQVVQATDTLLTQQHYYLPYCNATQIPICKRVVYTQVYPLIDWVLHTTEEGIKYDFVLQPGANVEAIRLQYNAPCKILADGSLIVQTPLGDLVENAPIAHQKGKNIPIRFELLPNNTIGFVISDEYNPDLPLVIDPLQRTIATYFGAQGVETITSSTFDVVGRLYLAGSTDSPDFPVKAGFSMQLRGGRDAFIACIDPRTGQRIWAAVYGGSNFEEALAVATGANTIAFGGITQSPDIARLNPLSFSALLQGDTDGFICRLDSTGLFVWATYFGGSSVDKITGLCVNNNNRISFCGTTESANIAFNLAQIQPAQQPISGGNGDGIVGQFTPLGQLRWGSYIGGAETERANAIACSPANNFVVVGATFSTNFPTQNAQQAMRKGNLDAFVTNWNESGTLLYSSYYGGSDYDEAFAVCVDAETNVYISGNTASTDFPTRNAVQTNFAGDWDLFVTKMNGIGQVDWATYYGGSEEELAGGISCDANGNIFVGGTTASVDFPVQDPNQWSLFGDLDGIFVQFTKTGHRVRASYYGGTERDLIYTTSVAPNNQIVFAGNTSSPNLSLTNPTKAVLGGTMDGFWLLFDPANTVSVSPTQSYSPLKITQQADYIHIESQRTDPLSVQIFDLLGKVFYDEQINAPTYPILLPIHTLNNGVYLLSIKQNNQRYHYRFLR